MKRGERIVNKTRSAIKKALLELIRRKNYPDITVIDIAERGDIGRSTLYKHYQSKADVLVDIHRDIFGKLLTGLSTAESWLTPEPSSELILFFKRTRRFEKTPFLLSYKLGSDLDYLISNIDLQLATIIEKKLCSSFNDGDSSIPLPILAQAITNLYSGLIKHWFTKCHSSDDRQFATNIQRMTMALILEAVGKKVI